LRSSVHCTQGKTMTTPTPEQLARLREIALRTALDNARKTNAASVNQRWMFDEYINEQSVAILESLLAVWREAQEEVEFFRKQAQCNEQIIIQHRADKHQLETLLKDYQGALKSTTDLAQDRTKEMLRLEASLRLAVSAMEKITCQCDYLKRLQVQSICFRCTTLSTIRANHPQLMEGEK
jgi:hypothetical protein